MPASKYNEIVEALPYLRDTQAEFVANMVTYLSKEDRKALAMFKCFEVSLAILSAEWKEYDELKELLTDFVKSILKNKEFVVAKRKYSIKPDACWNLICLTTSLYFNDKYDKNTKWKASRNYSAFLISELKEEMLSCLLDLYVDSSVHNYWFFAKLLEKVYNCIQFNPNALTERHFERFYLNRWQ